MTYFCSIGSQILYIFETHGIGQTPSSLERYLVLYLSNAMNCIGQTITALHLVCLVQVAHLTPSLSCPT